MANQEKVNILLVDDQPAKLLSYEVMLGELGENLIKSSSASEALAILLKKDVAVVLIDVCMPDLDGFELAAMIREHPRFQKTAIIFVSAIQFSDVDHIRGYAAGAVDYLSVPVIPELLRAKVKVFIELHRKTRQLEGLNEELERRVAERTAELESSNARLRDSEERRSLALQAGDMGSWDLNLKTGEYDWDEGQCRIYGVEQGNFIPTRDSIRAMLHADDRDRATVFNQDGSFNQSQVEFRIVRPNGEVRWCFGAIAPTLSASGEALRLSGVTVDITDRKDAEEKRALLAREVDHRARNALAVVQSILRLTRAETTEKYTEIVEGRIQAFAATHKLLSATRWEGAYLQEIVDAEMAPFLSDRNDRVVTGGPEIMLRPSTAQSVALALHEMVTNAAKYGALSQPGGTLRLTWNVGSEGLVLRWVEAGGPPVKQPSKIGFGLKIVRSGIEEQLDGKVVHEWRSDGINCTLTIPSTQIAKIAQDKEERPMNHVPAMNGQNYSALNGKRILVVEDEFLIAMSVEEILIDLGAGVVGPVNTLSDGLAVVQNESIDGAILDLNLRGEQTYALAEILTTRGVPFVFMTGYDSETVDRRYINVPVLQKPVESEALEQMLLSNLVRKVA